MSDWPEGQLRFYRACNTCHIYNWCYLECNDWECGCIQEMQYWDGEEE